MKFGNVELAPAEEKIINEIGWERFERSVDANTTYRAITPNSQIKGVVTAAHVVRMHNYIQTVNGIDFAKCIMRCYEKYGDMIHFGVGKPGEGLSFD